MNSSFWPIAEGEKVTQKSQKGRPLVAESKVTQMPQIAQICRPVAEGGIFLGASWCLFLWLDFRFRYNRTYFFCEK